MKGGGPGFGGGVERGGEVKIASEEAKGASGCAVEWERPLWNKRPVKTLTEKGKSHEVPTCGEQRGAARWTCNQRGGGSLCDRVYVCGSGLHRSRDP